MSYHWLLSFNKKVKIIKRILLKVRDVSQYDWINIKILEFKGIFE